MAPTSALIVRRLTRNTDRDSHDRRAFFGSLAGGCGLDRSDLGVRRASAGLGLDYCRDLNNVKLPYSKNIYSIRNPKYSSHACW